VAKADKDGIVRDRRTGIVLARKNRHPLADLFKDIPMGEGLPGMHMDPMAEHLLAIHIFDNLGCSPPQDPLYKSVPDPESLAATGSDRVLWVSVNIPDPVPEDEAGEQIEVADISGYDADQMAAMEFQMKQKRIADKMLEQADPQVRGEGEY
jgi:hypothetical protein